jgi:endonuclease YncB( thermonuclease family)
MRVRLIRGMAALVAAASSFAACSDSGNGPTAAAATTLQFGAASAADVFAGTPSVARAGDSVTIRINVRGSTDTAGRCVNIEVASVSDTVVQLRGVASGGTTQVCSFPASNSGTITVQVAKTFAATGTYTVEVLGVDTEGRAVTLKWSITVT